MNFPPFTVRNVLFYCRCGENPDDADLVTWMAVPVNARGDGSFRLTIDQTDARGVYGLYDEGFLPPATIEAQPTFTID